MTLDFKKFSLLLFALALLLGPQTRSTNAGGIYYVDTTGDDGSGDGSAGNPWATITHALLHVPDGSTVLVRPGTYSGQVKLQGNFSTGVTVPPTRHGFGTTAPS